MHIVEVGCMGHSSLHEMIPSADRVQIFEANPEHARTVCKLYEGYPQVQIHQVALWNKVGEVYLHSDGPSSYVHGLLSPSLTNDGTAGKTQLVAVPCSTFDRYDDGSIDVLEIDIEGAEWYVLERMKSRPRWISVELHWKTYVNPYFIEIKRWMQENGYELAKITESDAEFVRIAALV